MIYSCFSSKKSIKKDTKSAWMGVFPLISGVGLILQCSQNPRVSLEQDLSRLRFLLADLEFVAELGSAVKWRSRAAAGAHCSETFEFVQKIPRFCIMYCVLKSFQKVGLLQ